MTVLVIALSAAGACCAARRLAASPATSAATGALSHAAPASTSHGDRVGPGTVTVLHVPSVDRDVGVRDVWVYRPDVADTPVLPVVYMLHGVPGAASDFFQNGGPQMLDRLFASGIAPFVVAAPSGEGVAHPDTEWADSVDGRDLVESYLVERVIPAVEGVKRRDAAHRVLAGFSMGGYGAVNIAFRHPDLFGGAASFAGYFHIDDPDDVFGGDPGVEQANDPEIEVAHVTDVRLFIADGTADTEPVVQGELTKFARLAGPLVASGDLVVAPGGHGWDFVVAHLPELANFVSSVATTR